MGAVAAGEISVLECCSESLGELKALKNKRQEGKKKGKAATEASGRLRRGEGGTKPQQTGKENKLIIKVFFPAADFMQQSEQERQHFPG